MPNTIDKDGEWHPYFAVIPVRVYAYSEEERAAHKGQFNWLAVGRVERRWKIVSDDAGDGVMWEGWVYRSRQ